MKRREFAAVIVILISSCARMVSPGGGPIDDTPPEVISVSPQPGPSSGDLSRVVIEWSERLEQTSATVFLYPDIPHALRVSGSTMTVSLEETLGSRTVVVHVPAATSDRRGNEAGEPLDLVYSGEDSLPPGLISVELARQGGGTISDRTLVEIWTGAPDGEEELVRRTTADSTGRAEVAWLEPTGSYRVLCYEDPDRSFEWSSEREAGADTVVSLLPGADSMAVTMTMTVVDTVGPVLVEAEALDRYHLKLEFTEEVSIESFSRGTVLLSDSAGAAIPVAGGWLYGGITNRYVILETSDICPSTGEYLLRLSGVEDLLENPSIQDSMEIQATDSLPADSLRVRSHYPAPGGLNIDPAGPYNISFNYFVDLDDLGSMLTLIRVADSVGVQGVLQRTDGRSFRFTPEHQLVGEQQHRFDLLPGLETAWDDTMATGMSWAFVPAWGDEPGSISGAVSGTGAAVVILQVSRTGGEGDGSVRYATVQPGNYLLEEIPAGRYTVSAFVDANSNGSWDPWEPYGTHPGVVMVYPGLTSEEISVEILP